MNSIRMTAIAAVAALAWTTTASAANTGKLANAQKAAATFSALAAGSSQSGKPPRQSDPAVNVLLNAAFDTSDIDSGPPVPLSEMSKLSLRNQVVLKVGLAYILAGTGVKNPGPIPDTPAVRERIDRNAVEFAPEMGRYIDAQLHVQTAILKSVKAFVSAATPAQLQQPQIKSGLADISGGDVQMIQGVLSTWVLPGMSNAWRRGRIPALSACAVASNGLLTPEQATTLHDAAIEAAGRMTDGALKNDMTRIATTFTAR